MTNSTRLRLADASIRVDSMPIDGRDVMLTPSAEERLALAELLKVTAIDALEIKLHAVKFRGGMRVTGRLTAEITQPSVVTLNPLKQSISEPIDRIFLPTGEKEFAAAAGAEIFVDLEGEDFPDHFDGKDADLTDLVVETLGLAIDLYPRAPSESIDAKILSPDPAPESPFAVLRKLKDK